MSEATNQSNDRYLSNINRSTSNDKLTTPQQLTISLMSVTTANVFGPALLLGTKNENSEHGLVLLVFTTFVASFPIFVLLST